MIRGCRVGGNGPNMVEGTSLPLPSYPPRKPPTSDVGIRDGVLVLCMLPRILSADSADLGGGRADEIRFGAKKEKVSRILGRARGQA